jgi:hypothetical protein
MVAPTLEERLIALENEVARLRTRVEGEGLKTIGKTRPDFLDTMVGIHANSPMFEEMIRLLADDRERERGQAHRLAAQDETAA